MSIYIARIRNNSPEKWLRMRGYLVIAESSNLKRFFCGKFKVLRMTNQRFQAIHRNMNKGEFIPTYCVRFQALGLFPAIT